MCVCMCMKAGGKEVEEMTWQKHMESERQQSRTGGSPPQQTNKHWWRQETADRGTKECHILERVIRIIA